MHPHRWYVKWGADEASLRVPCQARENLTDANVSSSSSARDKTRHGGTKKCQQRKRCTFEKSSCNPRRAAPREGNMCRKHLLWDEFIIAFAQKAPPQTLSSGCPEIGRRQDAIGTPTTGAPNVTQAVSSRTIVAGMVGNVTYSEQLQNEQI